MARQITDTETLFALRTLRRCGRRGFKPWLRFGFWPGLARIYDLPQDVEDLVGEFLWEP